jgi:hypothetical protein
VGAAYRYGDLREVTQTCKEKGVVLKVEEQLFFCQQLARGMSHLAGRRFIHMDLAVGYIDSIVHSLLP